MPGTRTQSRDNLGHVSAAIRDGQIHQNNLVLDIEAQRLADTNDVLMGWLSAGNTAFSSNPIGRGTTDTNVATGALNYSIAGIQAAKAAVAAGTALGALGSIPQATWGVISVEIATGGTISFQSGAANYTTGYASEALALAAIPAPVTAKARLGVVTVLAPAASAFVVGTNSLAGGATTPAQTTNYYATVGIMAPTGNRNYVGGANGILIQSILSRGSTDTQVATTAFTYNANGIANIAKAAVAAGTAFANPSGADALSTVVAATPANKWALFVAYISAAGTIQWQAAPQNAAGYGTEAQAQADLPFVPKPVSSGCARVGYVTVQAKANGTFTPATDSLAGGASGNIAQATNYYAQPGQFGGVGVLQPYQQGMLAAQVGSTTSGVLADLSENFIATLPTASI